VRMVHAAGSPRQPPSDWQHLPEHLLALLGHEGISSAADWLALSTKARGSIFGIPPGTRRMLTETARRARS
jgi:hypothetical protein